MHYHLIKLATLLLCAVIGLASGAAPLSFGPDGKIKIVQFTDNHYKWGKKASDATVKCMESVLDAEQPDFVIFTGDLVYSDNVGQSIDAALRPVIDRGLPFAFVFGNHDTQFDMTYPQIYDLISSKPGSLMPPRGEAESPDYTIEIASSTDPAKTAAILYCLDSHGSAQVDGCGKYAWLELPQIEWYKSTGDSYSSQNGGKPMPSIMFFHIPLPEVEYAYNEAMNSEGAGRCIGTQGEKVCSPKLNSGMFAAIKEQGDVKGVFFGHDHDNDYVVNYYDVMLGYGRYSGGKTVYNHLGANGARVIEFDEPTGDIDTWIRLSTGETINPISSASKTKKK